jgi:colicin import membrane protein
MKKHVIHYFATHKDATECFSTSDGFLFHTAGNAGAHASTLKDDTVRGYGRHEFEEEVAEYLEELNETEDEKKLKAEAEAKKIADAEAKAKAKADADAKKAADAEAKAKAKEEAEAKKAADAEAAKGAGEGK